MLLPIRVLILLSLSPFGCSKIVPCERTATCLPASEADDDEARGEDDDAVTADDMSADADGGEDTPPDSGDDATYVDDAAVTGGADDDGGDSEGGLEVAADDDTPRDAGKPDDSGPKELPLCEAGATTDCVTCRGDDDCAGSLSCVAGQCQCALPSERLLTDSANCGACNVACGTATAGEAACVAGECKMKTCSSGYGDCNGLVEDGCETQAAFALPVLPSPRAPFAGQYTGSVLAAATGTLRPEFRWSAASSACGTTTYDLIVDDSCEPGDIENCVFSTPELAISTTNAHYRPEADLPVALDGAVGALYTWRVRACDGSKLCSGWTPARYVHVGRLPDDFNGDGRADLLTGTLEDDDTFSAVRLALSTKDQPLQDSRDWIVATGLKYPLSGDVGGDGYFDLLINGDKSGGNFGLFLIEGQKTPLPGTFPWLDQVARFRWGDVDADGYVEWAGKVDDGGSTPLFTFGSYLDALAVQPAREFAMGAGLEAVADTARMFPIGDVTGDALPDVVVLSALDSLVVYSAPLSGAATTLPLPSDWGSGASCLDDADATASAIGLGDVDDDGFGDFAVACPGFGWAVYLGAASLEEVRARSVDTTTELGTLLPYGDYDGDGEDELMRYHNGSGVLWTWYDGSIRRVGTLSALPQAKVVVARDFNGDGMLDIASGGQYRLGGSVSLGNVNNPAGEVLP